ncbi:hypothetical protein ABOM_001859 [Aspergillus bombycis]|uniref:Uncharacterized protein n=1 Tax=Aspergillus bombycis TaxID=109264 RepID=A0A1F8AE39_9EURO|nr:hypothetical protein ABOM_001859 [Aspergillus bombycis]OGM49645.1 hypothetical protein ABOM_001859 [Aspergillus bombycis]
MPAKRMLRAPFVSSHEATLGSLITSIKEPKLGAQVCPWPLGKIEDYAVRSVPDMYAVTQPAKEPGLSASISRLFKTGGSAGSNDMPPTGGKIYTLKKPRELFHNLSGEKVVRKWLQHRIAEKVDVYMLEGLATLEGCSSVCYMNSENSYPAQGELICAIRVLKVVFKPFRTKSIDYARLEKDSTWVVFSDGKPLRPPAAEWVEVSSDGKQSSLGDQNQQAVGENGHGGVFTFDEVRIEQARGPRDEVSWFSDDS